MKKNKKNVEKTNFRFQNQNPQTPKKQKQKNKKQICRILRTRRRSEGR